MRPDGGVCARGGGTGVCQPLNGAVACLLCFSAVLTFGFNPHLCVGPVHNTKDLPPGRASRLWLPQPYGGLPSDVRESATRWLGRCA